MSKQIPTDTLDAFKRHILYGHVTGSFCYAVLSNDLKGAFAYADARNKDALSEIVAWLYNYAPMASWGTPENVSAWQCQMTQPESEQLRQLLSEKLNPRE